MGSGQLAEDGAWFGVSLLYERKPFADAGDDEGLFEEQVILVQAASEEEAGTRAGELGAAGAHAYRNAYVEEVRWSFRSVLNVVQLLVEQLHDGSQVYYRFLNRREADDLRRSLEPETLGLEVDRNDKPRTGKRRNAER